MTAKRCPYCDADIKIEAEEIRENGFLTCSKCKKEIQACSICTAKQCGKCSLDGFHGFEGQEKSTVLSKRIVD
jgi:ssDNA-binding Zn-finger/Zn-ribbon topoisomerase 1